MVGEANERGVASLLASGDESAYRNSNIGRSESMRGKTRLDILLSRQFSTLGSSHGGVSVRAAPVGGAPQL